MWERTRGIFAEGTEPVFRAVTHLLPGLLAMLVLLLIAAIVAVGIRVGVRRVCRRFDLDRRLREAGVARPHVEGRAEPSEIVARIAGWFVLGLAFVAGLSTFEGTSAITERLLNYFPHVLVALVILVAGAIGARVAERAVLIGAVNMGIQSAHILGAAVRLLVATLTVTMALDHLGVGGSILVIAFSLLFGGIVLALALAIGLGARDLVARSLEKRFSEQPGKSEEAHPGDALHHL